MDVEFLTSAFRENQYPLPDRPEIAFAGRSNVGKSSLINTLVNRKKLAKTSSRPGRTQSINFFSLGSSIYLVDLPGYGFARVPMNIKKSWQSMVEKYLYKRDNLMAVVVIIDIRRDASQGDIDLLRWLNQYKIYFIMVLTKADKVSRQQAAVRSKLIKEQFSSVSVDTPLIFSAKTRQGRKEIWERISHVTGCEFNI
ncbi:MAG TPA: ribosome biogenesis GTP-binding protein YihA/YsxC [Desulfobacteraceae bacterium]|nr:ribosome biogenesis GTP-binding protein YihA/YsxC [Desulfobacteraceae bacterium]HPJ68739.1 ribosome biogenesis GTP-binding protein YihA/YsxC [Desulfobacteraceae bacterium]HPQ28788.1 ribosome biogenesis GTP-binding protein YihA/YsxC [Desulfobacteraceae bacterium]